jgi:hypothetical protein
MPMTAVGPGVVGGVSAGLKAEPEGTAGARDGRIDGAEGGALGAAVQPTTIERLMSNASRFMPLRRHRIDLVTSL